MSGLASRSQSSDQMVVKEFLSCLGSSNDTKDALDYLKSIQKMKGEWYNQQGKKFLRNTFSDTYFIFSNLIANLISDINYLFAY